MENLEINRNPRKTEESLPKVNYPPTLAADKTLKEILPVAREIKALSMQFLSSENVFIGKEEDTKIRREIFIESENVYNSLFKESGDKIVYDKYKKSFFSNGTKVSTGEILASRRFGNEFSLDKSILETGEGKRLVKFLREKKIEDLISEKYSKEMSKNLSEEFKKKDLLKSKAYEEIEKRSGENKEQFGIKAEQIFIGLLESLSFDRGDLGFSVYEANPWQDVENKVDFILERKNKKRGIGVEENKNEALKTIGIQFTTALNKREHKLDQINKAKNKIKELDDIIYVEIDSNVLRNAIKDSEKSNNKFTNPVKYLPINIKKQILENLFKEILSPEEIKSLERNI